MAARSQGAARRTLSFIRTVTVGSGIAPDLLTLGGLLAIQALAGCCLPGRYRWWGFPPRPENACARPQAGTGRIIGPAAALGGRACGNTRAAQGLGCVARAAPHLAPLATRPQHRRVQPAPSSKPISACAAAGLRAFAPLMNCTNTSRRARPSWRAPSASIRAGRRAARPAARCARARPTAPNPTADSRWRSRPGCASGGRR